MVNICLIGSSGSIGKQVCNVVRRYPDLFKITSIIAHSDAECVQKQAMEFFPSFVILTDEVALKRIHYVPQGTKISSAQEDIKQAIADCDVVFVAASGFAGLQYSLQAIEQGKKIALANKETLVCGGELVMKLVKEKNISLIPVDSEHSALWQALNFQRQADYKNLIITASGGAFYGYKKEQLKNVTPQQALNHPTWKMGAKITVDSATLLNKGFEVIEAKWLYNASLSQIKTVVQRESIIHSMVEFSDGAILAQLSYPTMELPIQLALTYPKRLPCNLPSLDFVKLRTLNFLPLERKEFPCYDLALQAAEAGDNYACALNGAGEIAVHAFLSGRIGFLQIADTMEEVLEKVEREKIVDYTTLKQTDAFAREQAEKYIKNVTQ